MSTESWPPPASPEAPWQTRQLRVRGPQFGADCQTVELEVREVRLWGKVVLLNRPEDAILCPHCQRFTPIADAYALNGHIGAGQGAVFRFRSGGGQLDEW